MPEQAQLTCVSCDTAFEPEPNGGFCPNCDTPHPDYGVDEDADVGGDATGGAEAEVDADADVDDGDEAEDAAAADDAADETEAADDSPSDSGYCPECGADLDPDARADDPEDDLAACPDCGRSVTDESYCPDCGRDLDAVRDEAGTEAAGEDETTDVGEESADEDTATADETPVEDEAEASGDAETVTLVVNGSRYEFEDGDTFGRRDDDWLEDLVAAAGGSDDVAYVSGEHLAFSIDDGDAFVVDVSRNGTNLNGTDLDGGKAELADGDTLVLAERAEVEVEL